MLNEEDIKNFEAYLTDVLFELDGEEYMRNSGDSRTSADGFLYCRCYIVAKGKSYYQEVLNDPIKMPKNIDQWYEPLLYIARDVWEEKNGTEWNFELEKSYETGSNEKK
ncbi:MAG: DUF4240 domain-containing protein [Candidatus Lokiarchaeota archaeon]|nr:DUF4240 domain-containing protein [Candidatus Lokiarchaeota archaeon]